MKVLHKKTPYRVCPHCGAHLDAGETCDCRQEPQRESCTARAGERKQKPLYRYLG